MNVNPRLSQKELVELVERSRSGDRSAYGQLVELYQTKAMRVAINLLGNCDDAAEAVQAAFVRAYQNVRKLRNAEVFGTWLFRIVTNTAISHLRDRCRRAQTTEQFNCTKASGGHTGPEANEKARELSHAIGEAMRRLPKKEAKAIALFALDDLSYAEVAGIMRCSVETARWYVHKARQKLKVLLKEYLQGTE